MSTSAGHLRGCERRLTRLIAALAATVFSALAAVGADRTGASPTVNAPYEDPDFQTWVERFERPGREVYDRRHAIVKALNLAPGMDVADVGAGTGLFTRLFAAQVQPGGTVYAVDISKTFIANVLRRSRESGQQNVVGIVNNQTDIGLPRESVDLVFVCATYHHFENPGSTLRSIHRALRTGGHLVVIDFRKVEGESSPWVMGHVRAGRKTVIQEVESAGFRLTEDRDLLKVNYFLRFEKIPK